MMLADVPLALLVVQIDLCRQWDMLHNHQTQKWNHRVSFEELYELIAD